MNTTDAAPLISTGGEPIKPVAEKKRYSLFYVGLWSMLSYFIISHFVIMTVQIQGKSMYPTLEDGERYTLFRLPYLWRTPKRGEIVVIKDPEDNNLSIKRIIALPHDHLQIKPDGVYVNNEKIREPYLTSAAVRQFNYNASDVVELAANKYFVLGDNRNVSADSRIYGPIPSDLILGTITK